MTASAGTGPRAATPHYYFVLPDAIRPIGGVNVQYRIIETLAAAGYRATALHGGRQYRYPFAGAGCEVCSLPELTESRVSLPRRLRRLGTWSYWQDRVARGRVESGPVNPRLERGPGDVFVLPEFSYPEMAPFFPDAPLILAAQDVFGLTRAFSRDVASGGAPLHRRFRVVYSTSQASGEAVRTLLGRESRPIGLPIDAASLRPLPKKLQIAYLPRKRKEESRLVLAALRARMGEAMPPVVPIVNMSDAERDRVYRESLFFLSFSQMEGFGLPPAEAMAAGCIVIGYTGVGGNEYFTSATGFPIADNDIIGFVSTVERLIRGYRDDPAPLDALRAAASAHVVAAHDPEAWRQTLLATWAEIDAGLRTDLAREAG